MAKRFTDTDKWADPWFSDMPVAFKFVYLYMLDSCDQVGVWKVNKRLVEFHVGNQVDWGSFVEYLGYRIYQINDEKWWMTKFCDFQYGTLDENSSSNAVKSHVSALKRHTLWVPYIKGTYKDKDKDKEKDKEKAQAKDKDKDQDKDQCEIIYAAYPKKVGKSVAIKAIEKALKAINFEDLLEKVKLYSSCTEGRDRQFIPHPSTWFNQGRWNDDPTEWCVEQTSAKNTYGRQEVSNDFLKTQMEDFMEDTKDDA